MSTMVPTANTIVDTGDGTAGVAGEHPPNSYTLGLDVSDIYTSYCLLSPAGDVEEEGRIKTTPASIQKRLESAPPSRVILEVGTHSPWISRLVDDSEHECVVANPHRVHLIGQGVRKSDRSDAETLARLGRIDPQLLSPVRHRDVERQAALAVLRARDGVLGARTKLINQVRGTAKAFGHRLPATDADTFARKAVLALPPVLLPALMPTLNAITALTQEVRRYDHAVSELIEEQFTEAKLLQQVPGVGPLVALTFVLTIGDPNRFVRSRDVGPYLGLVPRRRESGDRDPQLGITKVGDVQMRRLLVQSAHYILSRNGTESDLRTWGLQHAEIGGTNAKKRAVVAVARKLAVLLHRLWVTGLPYEPVRSAPITQ